MLPYFAEKLETTPLISSIYLPYITCTAKNGHAHMIMKDSAKKRKRKEELNQMMLDREIEKDKINKLSQAEAILTAAHCRIQDLPKILEDNKNMVSYLKQKSIMDQDGKLLI